MKERPILFSGSMILAILEGRKTQTRRILKAVGKPSFGGLANGCVDVKCPHGTAGDRFWVRETWRPRIAHGHGMNACDCADVLVLYAADGTERFFRDAETVDDWLMPVAAKRGNVPGIHMPRWASRITLEVTSVRVERLQEITEEDAIAEGVRPIGDVGCPCEGDDEEPGPHIAKCAWKDPGVDPDHEPHRAAFATLWDSINGKRATWASNPYCWVISFRRAGEKAGA